jgi:hypothetical protein
MMQIYLTLTLSTKGGEGNKGWLTALAYLTIHYCFEELL